MARQLGPFFIEFTSGNICFYKMNGNHYAREKSSLSGKRVKKSPCYAFTRKYAALLGESSKIASALYRRLPEHWRKFWMYQSFVGEANELLKQGKTREEAYAILWKCYAAEFEAGYEEEKEFVHVCREKRTRNKVQGTRNKVQGIRFRKQELHTGKISANDIVLQIPDADFDIGFYESCNYWAEAG